MVPFWDNVTISPLLLVLGRPLDVYTIRCGSKIEMGWPFLDTGWVVYDTPPVSHSHQLPLLLLFLSWLSDAFPGCRYCQQTFGIQHPPIIYDVGDGHCFSRSQHSNSLFLSCLALMSGGYLMYEQLTPSLPGLPPLSLLPKYSIFCILCLQSPADFQVPPTPSCSVQGAKFSETHWNIKPRKDGRLMWAHCRNSEPQLTLTAGTGHDVSVHWLSQNVRAVDIGHATKHRASLVSTSVFTTVLEIQKNINRYWVNMQWDYEVSKHNIFWMIFHLWKKSAQNQILSNQIQAAYVEMNWIWTRYLPMHLWSKQTNIFPDTASRMSLKVQRLRI